MAETLYLRCRNHVMTYMDPETHFKIPRGRVVRYDGKLTKTMRAWIRRGGLKVVDQSLFEKQNEVLQPSEKIPVDKTPDKSEPIVVEKSEKQEVSLDQKVKPKQPKKTKKKSNKED